jgi:hypothetical protein
LDFTGLNLVNIMTPALPFEIGAILSLDNAHLAPDLFPFCLLTTPARPTFSKKKDEKFFFFFSWPYVTTKYERTNSVCPVSII